ncbi:MAG: SDR family oxidoreductase, partial [Alphaproteobacteria bacterium]|nr:SDR family oxidoreductase [Alphaproteobacteria bacterium]
MLALDDTARGGVGQRVRLTNHKRVKGITRVKRRTNLRGVFLTAREGAKRLDKAGSRDSGRGRIILIGSITAEKIYAASSMYGATKAAVRHLGRSLAREWARRGINVNIIQPGYFESEMT